MQTNANAKRSNLGIDQISYGLGELICDGTPDEPGAGFQGKITEAGHRTAFS